MIEFDREFMQVIEESRFEVGFADGIGGFEPKEFEDAGISDGQFWLGLFGDGVRQVGELFFVRRQAGPLIIQSSNLPFERPHGPTFGCWSLYPLLHNSVGRRPLG